MRSASIHRAPELLEQPLPPGAEPFQRDLVARLAIDVAADESVRSVADAVSVVRQRTATVVNVGLSKLGGPTAALQAAQVAAAHTSRMSFPES